MDDPTEVRLCALDRAIKLRPTANPDEILATSKQFYDFLTNTAALALDVTNDPD